jgi:dTDP-4-dehydrorhamnose 3,5-epimerase
MKASEVTVQWLQSIEYTILPVTAGVTIADAMSRPLAVHLDGRGDVTELWSEPWEGVVRPAHVYQSATDYGVVKCWHLHEEHTDQFTVTRGKVQVTLVDVRENSSTFGTANKIIMGTLNPSLVKIPPGVLHGWKCLSLPEVIVVNLQTHVYDPSDEYKFPWKCILEEVWEPING